MIEKFWISIEKIGQAIEKFDRTIEKFDQTPLKNLTIYKKYRSRPGNLTLRDVGLIPDILDVPCRAQGSYPESFEALS